MNIFYYGYEPTSYVEDLEDTSPTTIPRTRELPEPTYRESSIPKPEPKKFSQAFTKVNDDLGKQIKKVRQDIEAVLELMHQEDADDVYDINSLDKSILDLVKEWDKFTECLKKELL